MAAALRLTPEVIAAAKSKIIARLRTGDTVLGAALAADVSRATFHKWFADDPDFERQYKAIVNARPNTWSQAARRVHMVNNEQLEPHAELAKLERLQRELAQIPGLQLAAKRAGDVEILRQLRQRETEMADEITLACIAVARADVADAAARVRRADERIEPARADSANAAQACESAKLQYARRRADSDRAYAEYIGTQQSAVAAHAVLADAEQRLQRLLNPDPPPPTPAGAQPHSEIGVLPQRGLNSWERSFVGCRRDE